MAPAGGIRASPGTCSSFKFWPVPSIQCENEPAHMKRVHVTLEKQQRLRPGYVYELSCQSFHCPDTYRNDHKFSDMHVWAKGVNRDQGLHCLLFRLHILDA